MNTALIGRIVSIIVELTFGVEQGHHANGFLCGRRFCRVVISRGDLLGNNVVKECITGYLLIGISERKKHGHGVAVRRGGFHVEGICGKFIGVVDVGDLGKAVIRIQADGSATAVGINDLDLNGKFVITVSCRFKGGVIAVCVELLVVDHKDFFILCFSKRISCIAPSGTLFRIVGAGAHDTRNGIFGIVRARRVLAPRGNGVGLRISGRGRKVAVRYERSEGFFFFFRRIIGFVIRTAAGKSRQRKREDEHKREKCDEIGLQSRFFHLIISD